MGKFKMPTVQQFLQKKRIYSRKEKREPEWVFLEKQMLENIETKPYNEKVHKWLMFLKELRYFYYCEAKRKEKRLLREVGPRWYVELSRVQRNVLADLKAVIHQDLLEDLPHRIRKSLSDLGLTLKINKNILMKTMAESVEDPGVFIWNLYKAIYNKSPTELRKRYDMNAMIMMSSLVFIDLEECVERLEKLTHYKKPPTVPKEKKKKKYFQPNVRYGEYLQKMYVPLITSATPKRRKEPLPLGNKFRLRSEESYEDLIKDESFLEKRKLRNKQEKEKERVCTYKFWEPPSTLRNTDPKMCAVVNKLKMLKQKAKPKFKGPYKNVQYLVGGVSFSSGAPCYILSSISVLPTGYIAINGGACMVDGTAVTTIEGFWKFPMPDKKKCDIECDCLTKWEKPVMDFIKESKCRCGHLYDLENKGKLKEKYFYEPTKHAPFWIDTAKIYQLDPMEDFIRDTFNEAMKSVPATAFLADLSDTPLLIPHLPQAKLLNNLQEWVRNRVQGPITPKQHKRLLLQSQRRWLDLKHVDHRARAFLIPFTLKQLEHFKWSHRHMVQNLFLILLEDFVSRNRIKQVEQTRMWWPTTMYDAYPGEAFLDIFFTYLPSRMKDTYFVNPYSSALTPKYGAKTCPLSF
ncbi:short spindle 5 isoform X2 [Anticarsia gemmatalis]|uniref:short spindle 5 isoform X2 n=1 Tax=Anticarsia gemmatalis TaxID=129554 RepID=UPI003F7757F7